MRFIESLLDRKISLRSNKKEDLKIRLLLAESKLQHAINMRQDMKFDVGLSENYPGIYSKNEAPLYLRDLVHRHKTVGFALIGSRIGGLTTARNRAEQAYKEFEVFPPQSVAQ